MYGVGLRQAADISDHRHRLLRAHRKQPNCRRAAEARDELTPLQLIEVHSVPVSKGRMAGYRIGEDQSAGNAGKFAIGPQKCGVAIVF
jgi:hypothetical protein